MWIKAKMKAGEGYEKRSKKRKIGKGGRYVMPSHEVGEARRRRAPRKGAMA